VQRLAGRRLYRALDLDHWRGQAVVRFTDPDVALDLGGIAKGYGVDRAVDALRARGVTQAVVNVGGDLYALGVAAGGGPWRVGIRSPEDPRRLAGELEVSDAAVATSGDYLQYFSYRGQRYHHLLDPHTAAPRRTPVRSVTVVAGTCLVADAAATAVFGSSRARAETVLRSRDATARVASIIPGGPGTA
jgi:thiamine biosynthesis lipoprotein